MKSFIFFFLFFLFVCFTMKILDVSVVVASTAGTPLLCKISGDRLLLALSFRELEVRASL